MNLLAIFIFLLTSSLYGQTTDDSTKVFKVIPGVFKEKLSEEILKILGDTNNTIATQTVQNITAQSDTIYALALKDSAYYKETNVYTKDKNQITIRQMLCYDIPDVDDEGFCTTLLIQIIDSNLFKKKQIINLLNDTSIIKCVWQYSSTWSNSQTVKINGTIKVILWTTDEIVLHENIFIYKETGKAKCIIYNGERKFVQKRK